MITEPGIYTDITEAAYHADPCKEVSASRSVIKTLVSRTPGHAFHSHARLNTEYEEQEENPKFDLGTAAHSILLDKGKNVHCAPEEWKAWQSKDAKEWRALIRNMGGVPMLQDQYARAHKMAEAITKQLPDHGLDHLFNHELGQPEVVAIANDPVGGMSRIMIDWLEKDLTITDIKTTDIELSYEALGRHCGAMQYEFQQAFYERVMVNLYPELAGRIKFRFLFCEAKPPFAILPVRLPNDALAKGHHNVEIGMRKWAECKASGKWPLFKTDGDVVVEYLPWQIAEFADYAGGE